MTMKEIPDIKYEIVDDGNLINIEQGFMDPVFVQLHKIHIKHFAEVLNIGLEQDDSSPKLVDYLEQINEQATKLFEILDANPNSHSHSKDIQPPCLVTARKLKDVANKTLTYWGNN